MDAVDNGSVEMGLDPAVYAFGRRLAVGAGSLFALLSLMADVSVPTAALRGGVSLLCVLLTFRLGAWVLERTLALDGAARGHAAGAEEEDPQR